ncbi:hypothetical protein LAV82_23125 [Bacillus sp. ILBB4]|nr:hypothetical protein [Bacillus sp. ILBB4]
MPELTLGLAPNKTSYFDQLTNFYLTLDKPVQTLTYTAPEQLSKITHALLCSVPALVLYEGQLPQESIDAWKAKFDKMFRTDMTKMQPSLDGERREPVAKQANRAYDRAERFSENIEEVAPVAQAAKDAEQVDLFQAQSVGEEETLEKEEKKETKVKSTRAKSAPKNTKSE